MTTKRAVKAVPEDDEVTFDLDSLRAARLEADEGVITFRWAGEVFTVPAAVEWPLTALPLVGRGNVVGALEIVLGTDDWERFTAHGPTVGDARDLFDSLAKASGFDGLGG